MNGGIIMSHFTVGVIVRKPEDLSAALAPYCEQDEDYMIREVEWTKQEYIEHYRQYNRDTELSDEEIWTLGQEEYCDRHDDENIYCYYNPDARWDWWVIGGRWRYGLKVLKNTEHIKDKDFFSGEPRKQRGRYRWCDGAQIKNILWDDMNRVSQKDIEKRARFWDVVVEGAEPKEGEDFGFSFSADYYRNKYGTKENYIMKEGLFYTHDVLDGITNEWHTMGTMGWFGCDDVTRNSFEDYVSHFYEIIQNPEYQDYWFIMVDCHI